MNEQAVRGLIGLAMRAGQLTMGVDMAANAIRAGGIAMALIDEAASENARKRISDTCAFYHAPMYTLPGGLLDEASGKSGRVAAAVKTGGIAQKLLTLLTSAE